MDKHQKNQIKRYIAWGCMALLVLFLAVMPLLAKENVQPEGPQASILTAQAEARNIETQIIGGGQLSGTSSWDITIPAEVKLTKYLVRNGDTVAEGDPIALVDKVTVMTALEAVQKTLDYLAEEITDASNDTQSNTVNAQAGGLVKILYAKPGDSVRDVMLRYGALAVLSLDGRMAVQIQADTGYTYGDTLRVVFSDGSEAKGRVESNLAGTLTVSVEDEGYAVDAEVAIRDGGTLVGQGKLYIHSPWKAAAYTGTIQSVSVREGDTVNAGRRLFQLDTSGHTSQFQVLVNQRQEYEELMHTLFEMYQTGVVCAPCDGLVTGVDTDAAFLLAASAEEAGWQILMLSNEEDGGDEEGGDGGEGGEGPTDPSDPTEESKPDEVTYSVLVGRVTACAEGTAILAAYPQTITCTDLNEIRVDTSLMTASISRGVSGIPIYLRDLTTPYGAPIVAGDILFFVQGSDGSSYVVWAGNSPIQSGGFGGFMPNFGGFYGGGGTAQVFQPYTLETLTVACVTSQDAMSLEITVDEQDIALMYPGLQAQVTVEALPGQTFPAVVTSVSNTGVNAGGSSKFTLKLRLEAQGDMLPGMNASAYLTLGTAENVLCIPVAALEDRGVESFVYTGYDEKNDVLTGAVKVTTGVSDGEYVQILSGLSQGDTIRYAYYDTLEISNIPEQNPLGF